MAKAGWSEIPEDLLRMIADRLFSDVELLRFRSVCRSWRSSAPARKLFPTCYFDPVDSLLYLNGHSLTRKAEDLTFKNALMSRAVFFRVAPSSSSSSQQSWLIKLEELKSGEKRLLCPLSRLPIYHSCTILNLLKFRVSAIHEAYAVSSLETLLMGRLPSGFKKVLLVPIAGETRFLGIGCDGKPRKWDGARWTKLNRNVNQLTDMIVHRGKIYAIDTDGVIWCDPSLSFIRHAPPLNTRCSVKRFVESCGELYIVERLPEGKTRKGQILRNAFALRNDSLDAAIFDDDGFTPCTVVVKSDSDAVGFKVHRLDEKRGTWEEVKSLGEQAFVMATDCCFSVSANEFEGCIANSIYFTDEQDDEKLGNGLSSHDLRMFKLDDGSITKMKSSYHCFQMFFPSFLQM